MYRGLGQEAYNNKKYEEAVTYLKKSINYAPDSESAKEAKKILERIKREAVEK